MDGLLGGLMHFMSVHPGSPIDIVSTNYSVDLTSRIGHCDVRTAIQQGGKIENGKIHW